MKKKIIKEKEGGRVKEKEKRKKEKKQAQKNHFERVVAEYKQTRTYKHAQNAHSLITRLQLNRQWSSKCERTAHTYTQTCVCLGAYTYKPPYE